MQVNGRSGRKTVQTENIRRQEKKIKKWAGKRNLLRITATVNVFLERFPP